METVCGIGITRQIDQWNKMERKETALYAYD